MILGILGENVHMQFSPMSPYPEKNSLPSTGSQDLILETTFLAAATHF